MYLEYLDFVGTRTIAYIEQVDRKLKLAIVSLDTGRIAEVPLAEHNDVWFFKTHPEHHRIIMIGYKKNDLVEIYESREKKAEKLADYHMLVDIARLIKNIFSLWDNYFSFCNIHIQLNLINDQFLLNFLLHILISLAKLSYTLKLLHHKWIICLDLSSTFSY